MTNRDVYSMGKNALRDEVIRLREKAALTESDGITITRHAVEKLQAFWEGYELAAKDTKELILPGMHLIRQMTNLIQYINGIAAAEVSKEALKKQLQDPRRQLGKVLEELDVLNAKVQKRYNSEDGFFDLSFGWLYRDALKRIEIGEVEGGDELRQLNQQYGGEIMEGQNMIRLDHINAPTKSTQILKEAFHKTQGTNRERGEAMIYNLQNMKGNDDWTEDHEQALDTLLIWRRDGDLVDRIKTYKSRWR